MNKKLRNSPPDISIIKKALINPLNFHQFNCPLQKESLSKNLKFITSVFWNILVNFIRKNRRKKLRKKLKRRPCRNFLKFKKIKIKESAIWNLKLNHYSTKPKILKNIKRKFKELLIFCWSWCSWEFQRWWKMLLNKPKKKEMS